MPVEYREITDSNDVGQRLDNFLLRVLKGVPRQLVYRIVRKGEVRVNKGRVQVSYRLTLGDVVRIPPVRMGTSSPVKISSSLGDKLMQEVLYEDNQLLVLNKPAGVAVHGGSGTAAGLIETLRAHLNIPRLELVHRIDKNTSGCLAMAKNRQALKTLQEAFRERTVSKNYELFVWGRWPTTLSTIHLKLMRYETSWGERRVRVDSQGQSARTDFRVIAVKDKVTRLQATLHTGRTHQIRVHTSANKYPILGDDKYGREDEIPRMCLHAKRLALPYAGKKLKLEAPVPTDLEDIWEGFS